ncbi:hypothetical protein [Streptomyces sp. NPDC127036]|uniref:hypothetical protein n=1 Tax=Streptomyces sp. NPDC127036 TaxID=3347112 RepID=UPI0036639C40
MFGEGIAAGASPSNHSDKDVAEWLPVESGTCSYITDWTVVKTRWGLTADAREEAALTPLAASCTDEPITVELAR